MIFRLTHDDGSTGDYEGTLQRGGLILLHGSRRDHLFSANSQRLGRLEVVDATVIERLALHSAGFKALRGVDLPDHLDNG